MPGWVAYQDSVSTKKIKERKKEPQAPQRYTYNYAIVIGILKNIPSFHE
jgi:hypothetical protein